MKNIHLSAVFLFFFFACSEEKEEDMLRPVNMPNSSIIEITIDDLERRMAYAEVSGNENFKIQDSLESFTGNTSIGGKTYNFINIALKKNDTSIQVVSLDIYLPLNTNRLIPDDGEINLAASTDALSSIYASIFVGGNNSVFSSSDSTEGKITISNSNENQRRFDVELEVFGLESNEDTEVDLKAIFRY